MKKECTVEAHIEEPRVFLGSLDRFLSNWLVFSIPACKILNKVLIYQPFFKQWGLLLLGHKVVPRQVYVPGNKLFIDSDLMYSHQGKSGGAKNFSVLARAMQRIIEKHSYIQYTPCTLAQFSEHL